MARREFDANTRKAAWKRCKERCEYPGCGIKLQVGKFAYDHIVPDGLGGEPTLSNCQVLCAAHHEIKTTEQDRPIMQKADNIKAKHLDFKPKSRGFRRPPPGYNWWTRRIERT